MPANSRWDLIQGLKGQFMFSARYKLCAVDWGKSEVAMAYSNVMLQNFASHWTARKVPGRDMQPAIRK